MHGTCIIKGTVSKTTCHYLLLKASKRKAAYVDFSRGRSQDQLHMVGSMGNKEVIVGQKLTSG